MTTIQDNADDERREEREIAVDGTGSETAEERGDISETNSTTHPSATESVEETAAGNPFIPSTDDLPSPTESSTPPPQSSTAPVTEVATSTISDTQCALPLVLRPVRFQSPYIEDQPSLTTGPDVFANNIKNAIELRKTQEGDDDDDEKEEEDGEHQEQANIEKEEDQDHVFVVPDNNASDIMKPQPPADSDETLAYLSEPASSERDPSAEVTKAHIAPADGDPLRVPQEDFASWAQSMSPASPASPPSPPPPPPPPPPSQPTVSNKDTTTAPTTTIAATTTTPTSSSSEVLVQAQEWHDSIVQRVQRLRGLSAWLGERNKRMDGMVEILVRSLEHMGVGAVTDHVGNLIPLQNFRLKSAIKLSPADNTWTSCDEDFLSTDINAWLPSSTPDDHNLSLTTEQMRKYESQVEALRSENDSLQRSLQAALDNRSGLESQVAQWQACIDSAGQQLSHVTQEVHGCKSRERHLRHLLGEERRLKDSIVQQNFAMAAEHRGQSAENVIAWQKSNELTGSQPQPQPVRSDDRANSGQGTTAEWHAGTGNALFHQPTMGALAASSARTGQQHRPLLTSPMTERRPWYRKQVSFGASRDARGSRQHTGASPARYANASSSRYGRGYGAANTYFNRSSVPDRQFTASPQHAARQGHMGSGVYHRRRQHGTNGRFNRLLDGFFDNLNRIEDALKQQGIPIPAPAAGPVSADPTGAHPRHITQSTLQQQQQQQLQDDTASQLPTNQAVYYTAVDQQPVMYDPAQTTDAQSIQQVQSVAVVQPALSAVHQTSQEDFPMAQAVVQPHQVHFAHIEGQAC